MGQIIYVPFRKVERKQKIKMIRSYYYIKKIIFTVFIATVLLALGASLTASYTLDMYKAVSTLTADNSEFSDQSDAPVSYCVKEFEGVIGVYDLSDRLMYTVDVYIKTLPERDREMLKKGICAESYEEVLEILGDYTA